ncbi:MAG: glycerol-3-phosphate 1-O-acyltransferase PlsY [Rickettsiales bacterium]|nr:glycerol-3-phosphate 1-O-acyltransferase PlsY [Rickettsiales bacterium]
MINQILFLVLTYLISAIPFGLVIAKVFAKKDIRKHGSKNIGATNVTRVVGKKLGLVTLILDGAKGAVMVIIARFNFVEIDNLHLFLALVSLVAVCGHIYPVYLNFKGGKGVATTIAVLLALDFKIGFLVIVFWIMFFCLFRISSIASLVAIASSIALSYNYEVPIEQIILCCFLFVIIAARHKENIIRLLCGEENSFQAKDETSS